MVMKASNEAAVEGMCSVVAQHASSRRGLSFCMYADEAMVAMNAPVAHRGDPYISESLDIMFGKRRKIRDDDGEADKRKKKKWRFWSVDQSNRITKITISKMTDSKRKKSSNFRFME